MKKILIVEDEVAYLELLTNQLTRRGYSVVGATDGKEGLEMVKKQKPDLILLDIMMPIMDGMVMLDKLRSQKDGKKTKVILLTNLEPDKEIAKKVAADKYAYHFVKSDTSFEELMAKIEELANHP